MQSRTEICLHACLKTVHATTTREPTKENGELSSKHISMKFNNQARICSACCVQPQVAAILDTCFHEVPNNRLLSFRRWHRHRKSIVIEIPLNQQKRPRHFSDITALLLPHRSEDKSVSFSPIVSRNFARLTIDNLAMETIAVLLPVILMDRKIAIL